MPRGSPTPPGLIAEIKRLKRDGLPASAIADHMRMARSTVRDVLRAIGRKKKRVVKTAVGGIIPPDMSSEKVFCEKCRATVYPPCLVCQLRRLRKRKAMESFPG